MSGTVVEEAWRTTHEPSFCSSFFSGEKCSIVSTWRSPTTMSASPATIGATSFGMSCPSYWLSASVLTTTSAPSLSAASSPAWKPAARPLLFVSLTMWSTPFSRATSIVRSLDPSSMTSHSTVSKPATVRGRSASVSGRVRSSLKQGIWMMSFMCAVAGPTGRADRSRRLAPQYSMRRPDRTTLALAGVLLGALALRLWGIRYGLPFSYNGDEERHFVPLAVRFFDDGLNPGYFLNPPGYTELLYVLYAAWFRGGGAVAHAYASDPTELFVLARVAVALLGVVAVWLLHLVGARLFDRRVGLLAAAIGAVAFLPVFYGHLALNDVPATAPATLALLGTALVLRGGGTRAVLLGGLGAGLAAGTKYTAGIVLLPLLTAIALEARERREPFVRAVAGPLAAAAGGAVAGFLLANPYALLDFPAFRDGVSRQRRLASGDELAKLGLTQPNGVVYYLWTFTWGVGWVPALAALAGALRLLLRDRRLALVLLPAPLLYVLFMGLQERYFGRWLLPVLPIAILVAAYAGTALVRAIAARAPRLALPAAALVAAALLAQGLVHSLHVDRVLARADTRADARAWLLAHVPAGAKVVVEPFVPERWLSDPDAAHPARPSGRRWRVWNAARSDVDDLGRPLPAGRTRFVKVDKYERTLRPALIDRYEARGFCWVVTGSHQYDRAFAQPREAPQAIAYYAALDARGDVAARFSPYRDGATPPPFNFDWSFDYYPLAYDRPGPEIVVHRLRGGRCS